MKTRAMVAVFVLIAAPSAIRAQASAYVPLDDISYTYVDALMARGQLHELSALERPFTERSLRLAIDSARTREPSETVSSYLDALYATIEKYAVRPGNEDTLATQTFRARGTGDAYVTAQTSGRRELMLVDSTTGVRPGGAVRFVMAGGPVVGFVRVLIDSRLNVDPEFAGRKDRKLAGRTEDGYVGGQWKYGELSFGRVGRNWGPATEYGLQLGNYAYTYDHLYGSIGNDKVHFSTVIARLDNLQLFPSGDLDQRYFAIHRLAFRRGNLEVAGTESYLYTGVGRGFEPTFANPLNVFSLSWRNEKQDGNLGLGGDLAYRSKLGTLAGQLFIDDLQIDRCNPNCKEPSSYGLTLSGEGLPLVGDQRWFTSYTRVANLTYRTPVAAETYEVLGVGLGRGFSDYDEARIGADLALLPRTPLRLYVAYRRQGQGDYRETYPTPAEYATTPGIFSGVVMRVTRLGVSGASRWRDMELGGDVGVNHITNDSHVVGATRTGFEGRVRLAIEPRGSVNF
ncbi:MAG: hypothetical protein ACRENK_01605 [Gemmatimonadaceae bacterium]